MGKQKHPLYTVWKGMRARCFNPNHVGYPRYGERGIFPVPEWDDYSKFFFWSIDHGYEKGLWLDRIDNDGPYSPENCRWVTPKKSGNNTSKNVIISAFDESKTVSEWGDDIRCAVPLNTVYQRLELGWTPEDAIIQPSKRRSTQRPLSFEWYQAVAESTAVYPDKGELGGLLYVVLGLGGEIGEFSNKMKKILRDHGGVLNEELRKGLLEELSDVLWYLSAVCSELGVSLAYVAQLNMDKLQSRQERGVLGGVGDDR